MQGQLPASTASGSFVKTPFPHLLVYALERRLTGTFELSRGSISMATILVMGGCPAKIRTSDPVHFLGNVLLELGMISPQHLQASLNALNGPPKQLQGQLLLQMGAVDAAYLDAGLRSQVERKVEHLFGLSNDTTFAYYDNVDLLAQYGGPPTPIDPFPVLWRGCREQPALEHVDATFRRIGTALIRIAPTAQVERFAFAPREREVIEMMRQRPLRAVDIVGAIGDQRLGQIFVYFLMIMKQVDLIESTQPMQAVNTAAMAAGQAAARTDSAPSSQRIAAAGMPQGSPSQQMPAAAAALGRVQLTRQTAQQRPLIVEESVAVVSSRDDRAAPPSGQVPPPSSGSSAFGGSAFGGSAFSAPPQQPQLQQPPTIPQAMQPQAMPPQQVQRPQTPPAAVVPPSQPALPAAPVINAPAGPLDIGSMIMNTIQQSNAPPAMTPSTPPAAVNVPKQGAVPKTPSVPGMPAVSVVSDAPPASTRPLTAEQNALKTKIIERAESITSQDYFQMLGIDRDATTDQIQKAFFALAKVWHPDRLPVALSDVKDSCSKVFTFITEAHQCLSDPGKRQDYIKLLKEGGATPEDQRKIQAILEAATEFQKAEFLLKRNPTDPQAHDIVRRCVELDDQPDYIATLTWLDAQRPEWLSREKTLEKALILDKCIAKSPNCERAYFFRGMLYKRAEEPSKALKDFKKAAELNPRNLDAMREVRLHNMRKDGGGPSKPTSPGGRPSAAPPAATEKLGGLFGKLFKK